MPQSSDKPVLPEKLKDSPQRTLHTSTHLLPQWGTCNWDAHLLTARGTGSLSRLPSGGRRWSLEEEGSGWKGESPRLAVYQGRNGSEHLSWQHRDSSCVSMPQVLALQECATVPGLCSGGKKKRRASGVLGRHPTY